MAILQIYWQIRTAHLERFAELDNDYDVQLVYHSQSYDFDLAFAERLNVRRLSFFRMISLLIRERPVIVELNEPTCFQIWPYLFSFIFIIRLLDRIKNSKTNIVAYAIDNLEPALALAGLIKVPYGLVRVPMRYAFKCLLLGYDQIAFGTQSAVKAYGRSAGHIPSSLTLKIFEPLDQACSTCSPVAKELAVIFLGHFDDRKGVIPLLNSWSEVSARVPAARLHVLGKGPLLSQVKNLCAAHPGIHLIVDPSRRQIHEYLNISRVLILLSQPAPYWKEQIGLPILEGLSHGCEIVSSDETGISDWLRANGHRVLPAGVSSTGLAQAIDDALSHSREPSVIRQFLPSENMRITAARWMWQWDNVAGRSVAPLKPAS
jgi:glycosyltransferase involved in cell wall biosynthesis